MTDYVSSDSSEFDRFTDWIGHHSIDVIGDGVSTDQSSYDRVYTNKNHLMMNERDEIIPDKNNEGSDVSSIKSILKHTQQKMRKINNTNRENNARRFLKQLDVMKSKLRGIV